VRGTEQIVVYSPGFGMHVIVLKDTVQTQGLNGGTKLISGDLQFWQKLDKGADQGILAGMQDFVTQTHSLFITLDEEQAFELFGDDFLFYEPGQRGQGPGAPVPVNIYLVWPRLP
jgi:hypothetical protein